jgi:hypothetical protein
MQVNDGSVQPALHSLLRTIPSSDPLDGRRRPVEPVAAGRCVHHNGRRPDHGVPKHNRSAPDGAAPCTGALRELALDLGWTWSHEADALWALSTPDGWREEAWRPDLRWAIGDRLRGTR